MKTDPPCGLAVLFPGMGYTCRQPLMQKCMAHYAVLGYETLCLDFSGIEFEKITDPGAAAPALERAAAAVKPQLTAQLADIDWQAYDDVVFVSKSLGTACAGWLESRLPMGVKPNQLYLTPLPQTLPFVTEASRVMGMVLGTEDHFLQADVLRAFCAQRDIPCMIVEGVGHNLRRPDPGETAQIDRRIVALCRP